MDRLPSDILYEIFIELPFRQKLECMLVNRQWENLIGTTCLFHTIYIDKSKPSQHFYKKFMDKMEQVPSLRHQVMNLSVTRTQRDVDRKRILFLFPNIRRIEMKSMYSKSLEDSNEDLEAVTSRNRVEYIRDLGGCELTRAMAMFNRCFYLHDLDLNLEALSLADINIFSELKNMPVLKRLVLRNGTLKADDFTVLHANIPSIEALKLESFLFDNESGAEITPATSITSLIATLDSMDDGDGFLLFASKKYPQLRHFSHQYGTYNNNEGNWHLFVNQEYPEIDHFAYQLHDGFYDSDEKAAWKHLYNVGYLPMLNNLGTHLQSLDLRGAEFSGYKILEKMDKAGCRIKKLIFNANRNNWLLSVLSKSDQVRSLEELTILDIRPCSFEWLQNIIALNSLELTYTYNIDVLGSDGIEPLCLRSLLESCPRTFKSLKLNCSLIYYQTVPSISFPLEKLELHCAVKTDGLDQFISNCLPNLKSLHLKGCVPKGGVLKIPNHHLSLFHFWITGHIISLSTSTLDKPLLYNTLDRKMHIVTPPSDRYIKPIGDPNCNDKPHATVVIHSAKSLYFNGAPVLF
jgi:hypothetical protein